MDKASNTRELMDINNLRYEEAGKLALVEEGGVFKKNNADQQVYSSTAGTELIVNLQSSTDFVYGPNCYLRFDVEATGLADDGYGGGVGVGFLNTPATALFSRFLLEDKSGAEVERVENINRAVRSCLPWKYPNEYRRTCEMAGQPQDKKAKANQTALYNYALNQNDTKENEGKANRLRVCIPLWYFSGLFHEETLLPPQLISGMRFRLSLARVQEALSIVCYSTADAPVDGELAVGALAFSIIDPVILLDTYSLGMSVQRNIQEQSQSQMGLPFGYETLYYQSGNAGTQTAYTQQVNKAVARAEKLWTQTQVPTAGSIFIDNLGSKPLSYFQIQHRIGDYYAQNQIIQLGETDTTAGSQRNCAELYINNLQNSQSSVMGMCMPSGIADPYRCVSVSLDNFRGLDDDGSAVAGNGSWSVLCQNVNQSPHIASSGIAVNNSRTAEVRIRYADDDGDDKQVQTWLQYYKVASVYPTRSVIKQ